MSMKKNFLIFILLSLVIFLGFGLRIYRVSELPVILNRDEAALAYNAYLLQETGQDEWGKEWPLTLKSFGDYKLPGYPILIIGSFYLFGVNDFAVRLPSVLAGTVLILLSYLFAKEFKLKEKYALFFSFLIAIAPVFSFYSRIGFEANVALSYLVASLYFIFKGKRDFAAILLMLLAIFTYNTPLLLLPFIVVLIPFMRGLKKPKEWWLLVSGLLCVLLIGGASLFSLASQKSGITIFTDETMWMESVLYREQFYGIWQKLFGNKYVFWLRIVLQNYWESFSYLFLVKNGGSHPWHSIPNFGHIYGASYVLALIGIFYELIQILKNLIKRKKFLTNKIFLLYLLIIALLPSVVTVDSPHATRSLLFFFLLNLMAVFGLQALEMFFSKSFNIKKQYVIAAVLGVMLSQSTNYFKNYFINYPDHQPDSLNVDFKNVIQDVSRNHPTEKIAVVDEEGFQYILTAWYLKTPPEIFQNSIVMQLPDKIGFNYGEQMDRFHYVAKADDRREDEKVVVERIDGVWKINNYK